MSARDDLLAALLVERYAPTPARPPHVRPELDDSPARVVERRRAAAAELDGFDPRRRRPDAPAPADDPPPPAPTGDRDALRRLMPGRAAS